MAGDAAPATDGSVRWLGWRKIMSETNDELRELLDDEIEGVTGGLVVLAIIQPLIALLLPAVQSSRQP
jgi:hypothetical protein